MRGDKRGPENRGPKTGRGLGYCNGKDKPGFESQEPAQGMRRGYGAGGRGLGRGSGRGHGRDNAWQMSRENGSMPLKESSEILNRLEKIEERLNSVGEK